MTDTTFLGKDFSKAVDKKCITIGFVIMFKLNNRLNFSLAH